MGSRNKSKDNFDIKIRNKGYKTKPRTLRLRKKSKIMENPGAEPLIV